MTGVDLAHVAVAQAKKNAEALKPGGLLVAEGFANPPKQVGFQTEELARAFTRLRIVRDETVEDYPAWYLPEKRPGAVCGGEATITSPLGPLRPVCPLIPH